MNKSKYATLALLLIVPFILTACQTKSKGTTTSDTGSKLLDDSKKEVTQASDEVKGAGSMLDLIKLGKSLKCTVKLTDKDTTEQTMYVSGKKMRMDMTLKKEDSTESGMETHTIIDETTMYSWTSLTNEGTKMNLQDLQDSAPSPTVTTPDKNEPIQKKADINQKVSYSCLPWLVDKTKFEVPTTINFRDITEDIKNMKQNLTPEKLKDFKQNACGVCASLSGDLRTECEANCN
jgi:hypothetical protein